MPMPLQKLLNVVMRRMRRSLAIMLLTCLYGGAWLTAKILRRRGPAPDPTGRILVIATFHNPSWFYSHIEPLALSGIREIVLISDGPSAPMPGVRYACPPGWLSKILSRALAKFLWAVIHGIRLRPDLYMGYHIMPAGISALILGRLFNRPACYQLTSGPAQLEGGGWQTGNALLRALGRSSRLIERLALAVTREFDLVVVRGSGAKAFLEKARFKNKLMVITAGVKWPGGRYSYADRDIDLVFVGRIVRDKRPDYFVSLVAQVSWAIPRVRAAVIGDGPELSRTQQLAAEMGIANQLEFMGQRSDVLSLMARSKIFVLPSRSEGVSIAMLEAMTAGTVPIVSDVGDLSDVVEDGKNGFLIAKNADGDFSLKAVELLTQPTVWDTYSRASAQKAQACCALEVIAHRWREAFNGLVSTHHRESGAQDLSLR